MDVQFNIISYAVIATKFETSSSLLESFIPLVENALLFVEKDCIEETSINDTYEEIYGYRIHSAILSQLLQVLIKQDKIIKLKREYIQINKSKLTTYDSKEEYEIKLRRLINELDEFLKKKNISYERKYISESIISFLHRNTLDFNSFINYNSNFDEYNSDESIDPYLIEFLLEERRNDTPQYAFIKDIYEGLVLSSIIITNKDIVTSYKEDFKLNNVLLDSNYIFRLLDLQTTLEYHAAMDTYTALKEMGCKFWVCKDTLKQISIVAEAVSKNYSETSHTIIRNYGDDKFAGIASAFIRRSLTPSKLKVIVDGLEDTLKNRFGIEMLDEDTFNVDTIDTTNDIFKELQGKKPDSSKFGVAHDLLLIETVSTKRPKSVYKSNNADWWVLTDDNRLTSWNAKRSSVPECITEAQLATIMWLCNPQVASLDGLFNTVVALKSRDLIGTDEYSKISKEIERQKERYASDQTKSKKLALVWSQQLLRLEDLYCEDTATVDTKFDELLEEAQENATKDKRIIEKQKQSIEEFEKQSSGLSRQVVEAHGLISKKNEQLIQIHKALYDDKNLRHTELKEKINAIDNKSNRRIGITACILRILLCFILFLVLYHCLPLIKSLEKWYTQNQLLFLILTIVISWMPLIINLKIEWFDKTLTFLSKLIIAFLVKCKLLKDLEFERVTIEENAKEVLSDMNNIQIEIEKILKNI